MIPINPSIDVRTAVDYTSVSRERLKMANNSVTIGDDPVFPLAHTDPPGKSRESPRAHLPRIITAIREESR